MVLKKPYAFLIKNFKMIHLALFGVFFLIATMFGKINTFFSEYVKGNIRGTINLAAEYINPLLYILIFIVIIFSLSMFLLMRKKEKPTLLYIGIFTYYLILFILVLVAVGVMNSIEAASLTQQSSLAYRDVYLILSLPQYFFLVMGIIRGIGFDVKKFNFNKDLAELEIKSEDNEEFEFVLGTDVYKYKRKVRRFIRELKYYILENKFIFSIISIVVASFILGLIFTNFNILNLFNRVGSTGTVNNINYKILSAYETKFDYNGQEISAGHKYIIVEMNLTNKTSVSQKISNISIYLKVGNKNIYNSPSLRNYFIDLGKTYINNEVPSNTSGKYLLVFELEENSNNNYQLNVLKNINREKEGAIYNYSKIKIVPDKLDKKIDVVERKINEVMYLGENIFGNTNLIFRSAEIKSSYEYKYQLCDKKNECKEYYDVIAPSNTANNSLLILNYNLKLEENIGLRESITNDKMFFDKFLKLEYYYVNQKLIKNLDVKISPNLKNMIFIEIPKTAVRSDFSNLLIKTRNNSYYINLSSI